MKKLLLSTLLTISFLGSSFAETKSVVLLNKIKSSSILNAKPAEGAGIGKIAIKTNLFGYLLKNYNLQGEYGFHKNLSVAVTLGLIRGLSLPKSVTSGLSVVPVFSGYGVTPELRFYPGKKEENQAPHGFYLAPYARFSGYKVSADLDYNDGTKTYETTVSAGVRGVGAGLMMGSQWLVGKHFTIDWWILGGGMNKYNVIVTASNPQFKDFTDDQMEDYNNSLNDEFSGQSGPLSNLKSSASLSGDKITVKISGIPAIGALRTGFCLGAYF